MLHLVYSPEWFYGKDIIIDIVSIFVLLLVAIFSLRYYKLKNNKKFLHLAISFGLIAISFIFKILMNFEINYDVVKTTHVGNLLLTYQTVESNESLFFVGFLMYKILALLGLYVLYSIYNEQSTLNHILIGTLIIGIVYFSYTQYHIFHLISFIILTLILIKYLKNYVDKTHISTILMTLGFVTIAVSQILFMIIGLNLDIYVIAEIIQLIGYICILSTLFMVLRIGKKKITN